MLSFLLLAAAVFPEPFVPSDNPMSAAKVELGRHLFYDKRLSGNGQQSCASCHRQELAFTDGLARAKGSTGEVHPRSSMSLANVGFYPSLTWVKPGEVTRLEQQALVPMLGTNPVELGTREAELLRALREDTVYQRLFTAAFPGEGAVSLENVTKAIAAFERTLVSTNSPYDRYRYGGEADAISAAAKRGEVVFFSSRKAGCFQCHGGWNLGGPVQYQGQKQEPRRERVRTPSLRNIAVTAPYLHDGSVATLEALVEGYAAGTLREHLAKEDALLRPLPGLTAQDKADLVEFLKSLTDEGFLRDARFADPWRTR
ncbi:di-heme enzyme [Bryobacterales bacterium F-183]|nr:di-heme enzyme [Bryobacterales bacterium F-183]